MKKLEYEFIKTSIENEEGYILLTEKSEYKNTKTKLKILCPNKELWETKYNNFQQGQRCPCPNCGNLKPLKYEYVKSYIQFQGDELLSETYINNSTPLEIRCTEGHIYYPKFNNYKDNNTRCPICNESKGEKEVVKCLKDYNINYIKQHKFDGCKYKRKLPFDFYLPDYNILIEYDGKQHYIEGCFGDDGKEYKETQKRDKIKTNYAKKNNIKLIRIPYWDFDNIENILKNKLKL